MELNHLKYFYAVAKEGGFTKASLVLKVAQPSISKLVNHLERDLGFEVFEKVGRNVRLTKRGGDVFRHCEVIFGEVEKIHSLSGAKAGSARGPLNLGGSEAVVSHFIPKMIGSLRSKFPSIIPTVVTAPASDLLDRILNHQIEMGLLLHAPDLISELEIRKEFPIPHRIVIATNKFRSDLVRSCFIGSRELDDTSTRSYPTLRRLRNEIPDTSIIASTNSITAQRQMVLEGLGVAVMPLFMVEDAIRKGQLKCLFEREKFEWPLRVVARRDHVFSRNAEVFLDCLSEFYKLNGEFRGGIGRAASS